MPGLFIDVELSDAVRNDPEIAKKLEEVCPVSIFVAKSSGVEIDEENLDECTLCALCLGVKPGAVKVLKLYDEGRELDPPA